MTLNLNERIYYYFNEITKIPHGSRNERQISDWLVQFARDHQLRWIQDAMGNVVIYKNGSAHKQNAGAIILQAHMDMVCEKEPDVDFNFETDPLNTYVEDGWLKARGTTLGADDGVGVAMMLAVLEDESLPHPPLECVFTVMEEIGLNGAQALKKEYFTAKRMINMDCGGEDKTVVTTAGGLVCTLSASPAMSANADPGYRLIVSGLKGGHSGGSIDKELGNANKIAARGLRQLIKQGVSVRLYDWDGGNKDNAIPRDCWISFTSPAPQDTLNEAVTQLLNTVRQELRDSDPRVQIRLESASSPAEAYSCQDSEAMIGLLTLLPSGVRAKSMAIPGLTWASENLASIKKDGTMLRISLSLRSGQQSWIDRMADELSLYAELFGWECRFDNGYPAWDYKEHSELRDTLAALVEKRIGQPLKIDAAHGGTECGVFSQLIEDLDIVTLVPQASGAHTPKEMLNLASFKRVYQLLCELLAQLN